METGWNLMFCDKRSGDVLVSKLLVSHGRPRKHAFFITIHTACVDVGGVVSPLWRAVLTMPLTAHTEREFPHKIPPQNSPTWFPLALSWKTSASFLSSCWPSSHASVLPTLSSARDWSFLSCCHLSPRSQVVLAGGRGFQSLSLLSWAAWPCSHHGRKLLLETMSILILFTKFCTETHFPWGGKFSQTTM